MITFFTWMLLAICFATLAYTHCNADDVFMVEGGLIYLDKPVDGGFAAYQDGFSILEVCRNYYRDAGLDVQQLDTLIR